MAQIRPQLGSRFKPQLQLAKVQRCVINLHIHETVEEHFMARVQLVIPDADKTRFVHQARREGLSLSAWLRAAAKDRLAEKHNAKGFKSVEDMKAFFDECLEKAGPGPEPDWEEYKAIISESKLKGLPKP